MSTTDNSKVLKSTEVARQLGCTPPTVTKLAEQGALAGFKVGTYWRFRQADVDAFIAAGGTSDRKRGGAK